MRPDEVQRIGLLRIGRGLRERRIALGWSQRSLARATGINQSTISRAERGLIRGLRLRYLATLWQALGIEAPWFPRLPE
jgi:transcriptional regulator with XRE-family HTH domain